MDFRFLKELIEKLEIMFPDRLPLDKDISYQELSYLQGQQSVVNIIKQMYEEETNGWNTRTNSINA